MRALRPPGRTRSVAITAVIAVLMALFSALAAPQQAAAAHFRGASLTWTHVGATDSRQVQFHLVWSQRLDTTSRTLGSTFGGPGLVFGDGTSAATPLTITNVDTANNLAIGEVRIVKTYPSGTTVYDAYASSCCRLSTLLNNRDQALTVRTKVRANDAGSPSSSMPPMVDCGLSSACNFYVSAVDPAYRTLRWRMSTQNDSGAPTQPAGASVDATTGLYSFTTTSTTGLYSSAVTIEALDSTGAIVSSTAVDFLIRVSAATSNIRPAFSTTTPADNGKVSGSVGNPVAFDVGASDANTADVVRLSMLGTPSGATFTTAPTPSNPASGSFRWTPTAAGQYVVNLVAADQSGAQTSRSVTLDIAASTPTISWNPPAAIVYGTPLGDTQLNATVDEPGATGTLSYKLADGTTAVGKVLDAGLGQALIVSYTPDAAARGKFAATSKTVTIDVSQAPQTISVTDPGLHRFGGEPFTLAATSSSGLPVSFLSSTPSVCTVSGSVATLLSAGDCSIVASQAGDANRAAAPPVTVSVTVAKADPVLAWSKTGPETLTSRTSLRAAGITPVWPTQPGEQSITDAAQNPVDLDAVLDAGDGQVFYATFTPADAVRYNAVTTAVTVDVDKDAQVITAPTAPARVTYGASPLSLATTGGASGNPVTTTSTTGGTCVVNGASVTFTAAGTCSVQLDQAGNGNFHDAAPVTVTIEVDRAAPALTWAPAATQLIYGDELGHDLLNAAVDPSGYGQPPVGSYDYLFANGADAHHAYPAAGDDQQVTVVWTPDAASAPYFASVRTTRVFDVAKATPRLTMTDSSSTYGDPLGASHLNAVQAAGSAATGAITYTLGGQPLTSGATPDAGSHAVTATFTPDAESRSNFTTAQASATLEVRRAAQQITAAAVTTPISFGDAPLAYTASGGASGSPIVFTTADADVCTATSTGAESADIAVLHAGDCALTLTQAGNGNYLAADPVVVSFTTLRRATTVEWAVPAAIVYGTPVGSDQLTATVAPAAATGNISYALADGSDPRGRVLDAHDYEVTAYFTPRTGDDAASQKTVTLSVEQAPQSVTFTDVDDQTFGNAPVRLHATGGGSGQPVTFAVEAGRACAIDSADATLLRITGAGTCVVTASQDGNGNHLDAADVSQTITVARAGQSVSFPDPADLTYGDQPVDLVATGGGSGQPVTFTSSTTSVCTVAGAGVLTAHVAGVCTVTAHQAGDDDWAPATDVSVDITVARAPQRLALAAIAGKTFGGPAVQAVLTPGGSTSAAVLTADAGSTCAVNGTSISLTGAGTCSLTATQAGDSNWLDATAVQRSFTIAKATPVVAWETPAAQVYEQRLTAAQLAAAVTPAGLNGALVYTDQTGAVLALGDGLAAGEHTLTATFTPSGTDAANYESAAASASLTVSRAGQLVSFTGLAARTWGDAPFVVTGQGGRSGQPVTFAAVSDCTVSDATTRNEATITLTGAGTCTVRADQQGDANYEAAPQVSQDADVHKATPTLSWTAPAPIVYGTPLGSEQLTASVDQDGVTGSIAYTLADGSNAAGKVLDAGRQQQLTATFTPDTATGRNWNGQVRSVSLDVQKAPQQLVFGALPTVTFGDADAALTATPGASGVAVTFTASGPCTVVDGPAVRFDHAGTCSVTAAQDGSSNWLPSPPVTRTFTVRQAPQAITFATPAAKTFGDPVFSLAASGGGSLQPVTFTADNSGVCTTTAAGTVTLLKGGSCALTAHQAGSSDYLAAASVTRVLVVQRAEQAITFTLSGTRTLGDPAFTIAASSSSSLPVRFTADGPCTVSGSSVSMTGVGTCSLTASQDGSAQYLAAPDVTRSVDITYRTVLGFKNTKAAQQGSTIPVKVSIIGAAGAALNDAALQLTDVTVDGAPAPYPGDSQIGYVFTRTGSGYQYNVKTTGFSSGMHLMSYSVTGDPVRHTIQLFVR